MYAPNLIYPFLKVFPSRLFIVLARSRACSPIQALPSWGIRLEGVGKPVSSMAVLWIGEAPWYDGKGFDAGLHQPSIQLLI